MNNEPHITNNGPYTIFEVMELIKDNKELIFELRSYSHKHDHRILACEPISPDNYFLRYFLKPQDVWIDNKWIVAAYIPLSTKLEWYISKLTKEELQKSFDTYGIKNRKQK